MEYSTGANKDFFWLETHNLSLGDLIKQLPELFVNKYVYNLYFDGDPIKPLGINITDPEMLNQLPADNHDQWILTKENRQEVISTAYVDYIYFSLIDWEVEIQNLYDKDEVDFINLYSNERKELKEKFWKEMEEIDPFNFVSDGSKLIFVTKANSEIDKIKSLFR